ncbi:MAG TPA: alpha/beta fold hydrolase [Chloroflexota bacterium]
MAATATALTAESTSKFESVGDFKLHYNEAGTGPAVVMVHGGGPGASGWSNFQRNIGSFAEHHRTLLVDMPQFGQSDSVVVTEPRSQHTARAICALLDKLGIEKASLVGNSMGGGASINFAIDYPNRIDKLVVMGSSGAGQSLFAPMPTEGIKVLNQVFNDPTADGMRRLINLMVYDSSFLTEELLQDRLQAALNPGHLEARKKSGNAQRDLGAELGKITAPTLILWGRDDRVVPMDTGLRLLAGLPGSQMHIFGHCGHWVQFEHADEFNRLVLDFLAN